MKKLTLDKVVEYVLILAITMVLVLIGNCINTITDGNPGYVCIGSGWNSWYADLIWYRISKPLYCTVHAEDSGNHLYYYLWNSAGNALQHCDRSVCGRTGGKDRTSSGSLSGTGICRCVYQ